MLPMFPLSIRDNKRPSGPVKCSCPTKSSRCCGRSCSAKGAASFRYPPGGACTEGGFGVNIEAICTGALLLELGSPPDRRGRFAGGVGSSSTSMVCVCEDDATSVSSCEDVGRVSGPRLPKVNIEASLVLLAGVRVLSRVVALLLMSVLLGLSVDGALCVVGFVEPQLLSRCSLILLSSTFCSHIGLHSRHKRLEISHY
jgi:hypothetical protein